MDWRHFIIFTQFEFLLMETWPIFTYDKIIIIRKKTKKQFGGNVKKDLGRGKASQIKYWIIIIVSWQQVGGMNLTKEQILINLLQV